MCLSDLARVIHHDVDNYDALVDIDGRTTTVSTVALGLDAPSMSTGDWIVVHTGLAVERLTPEEAERILDARDGLRRTEPRKEPT
jgi:hydrogenase expression/formation protein HypC